MYQPDFPSVPFRLGLYPVVDSVAWIERLLACGVRTIQLRVATTRACLSTTTGDWPLSTRRTVCIWVRRTWKQRT